MLDYSDDLRGAWEEFYRKRSPEELQFVCRDLDPDFEAAMVRCGLSSGCILDVGTGPGTQAIEIAKKGFNVTGVDISPHIIADARQRARERSAPVCFIEGNVLSGELTGEFDAALDRGCFHGLPPSWRARYVQNVRRLIKKSGWLFLKTFTPPIDSPAGPYSFEEKDIRTLFSEAFEVFETVGTIYQGQFDSPPPALLSILRAI